MTFLKILLTGFFVMLGSVLVISLFSDSVDKKDGYGVIALVTIFICACTIAAMWG